MFRSFITSRSASTVVSVSGNSDATSSKHADSRDAAVDLLNELIPETLTLVVVPDGGRPELLSRFRMNDEPHAWP